MLLAADAMAPFRHERRGIACFDIATQPLAEFGLPRGDGSYVFRNLAYRFWAVGLDDYVAHLRSRGPAWKAVAMARAAFRKRVRPLQEWLPMTTQALKRPRPVKELDR